MKQVLEWKAAGILDDEGVKVEVTRLQKAREAAEQQSNIQCWYCSHFTKGLEF